MKTKTQRLLTTAFLLWGASAAADVLELKNGTILNGKYSGGTAGAVNFTTGARFFQIENQLNAAIDLRIAASLPLIK